MPAFVSFDGDKYTIKPTLASQAGIYIIQLNITDVCTNPNSSVYYFTIMVLKQTSSTTSSS